MTNPGTPLRGTVTLNGTGADAGSGMASLRFEYKPSAGSDLDDGLHRRHAASPFSCSWDTTTVADGSYDLRSVAIDVAGNTSSSATVAARVVDNTGPAVSRHRARACSAAHHDRQRHGDRRHRRRSRVAIQYSLAGAGSWTTICTDTTAPYSCSWNAAGAAPTAPTTCARSPPTRSATRRTSARRAAPTSTTPARPAPTSRAPTAASNDRLDAGDTVIFTYSAGDRARLDPRRLERRAPTAIRVRVNNNGTPDYDGVLRRREHDAARPARPRGTALHDERQPRHRRDACFNATIAPLGLDVHGHDRHADLGRRHGRAANGQARRWSGSPSSQATNLATGIARAGRRRSTETGGNGHRLLMAGRLPQLSAAARSRSRSTRCSALLALGLAFAPPGEGAPSCGSRRASGSLSLSNSKEGAGDLPRRRDAPRPGGQRLGARSPTPAP